MTPWPLNKPLLATTALSDVEASAVVWERATPKQLRACWEGPLPTASVLPATLDDRRLELLALRLASSYQAAQARLSPQDTFGREVLDDVCGPHLSAADKEEGFKLTTAGWQMTHRARYSSTKIKPVAKVVELLSPSWRWADPAGVSWLAGCGRAVFRRFKTGVVVEMSSPQTALDSILTPAHRWRRRPGELEAAWPLLGPKPPSPRL